MRKLSVKSILEKQMHMETYAPSHFLSNFIRHYIVVESQNDFVNRILPSTSIVMAFRFRGQANEIKNDLAVALSPSIISGLRKSNRLIQYTTGTGNILVLFKEAGAHAFLREPVYELEEESFSLDTLPSYRDTAELEEKLAASTSNEQRIVLIEQFLLSKLYTHKQDTLIHVAVEKIRTTRGILKMTDLASELCISQDPFEKRFKKAVGISPKQFSYIVRMQSVLQGDLKKQAFTETAFHAGYFDQSHFNKDFKRFTGLSPKEYLQSPVNW